LVLHFQVLHFQSTPDDRDLCLQHLHSTPPPVGGIAVLAIAMPFGMGKLEWFGDPKVKNVEDMITRFGRIHERDGRTGGRTLHNGIGRAGLFAARCYASAADFAALLGLRTAIAGEFFVCDRLCFLLRLLLLPLCVKTTLLSA